MFARVTSTFLATLLVLGFGIGHATAEDREDARQREAVERAKIKPNDASDIASRAVPNGRVLDVDVETIRGAVTYAVEIEKDGRVRIVLVDLEKGDVLSVRTKEDEDDDDDDE